MTISQDFSAPLIVVVGATGAQGSSVVRNLANSDKPYRIRGFTRDSSKPASKELSNQGVEVFEVDPTVKNQERVQKGFEGATYAFAVTLPAIMSSKEQEYAEGKMFVDAAKSANVKLLIWSGLPNVTKRSNGKYTAVSHFDAKAAITDYARSQGVPFIDVQAGGYMQNFLNPVNPMALRKQPDGTFAMIGTIPANSLLPLIDTDRDYGLWVRKAIEGGYDVGSEVHACAEWLPLDEALATLSEFTGKTVKYVEITDEQFTQNLAAAGLPASSVLAIVEVFHFAAEYGYWDKQGGESIGLARPPRKWTEFVKDTDWSKILA